jgi:hypothetical protein
MFIIELKSCVKGRSQNDVQDLLSVASMPLPCRRNAAKASCYLHHTQPKRTSVLCPDQQSVWHARRFIRWLHVLDLGASVIQVQYDQLMEDIHEFLMVHINSPPLTNR